MSGLFTKDGQSYAWNETRSWNERGRTVVEVVYQSVRDLLTDSGPQWAAAIAYYALLSTFPLIVLGASLAAYFVDVQWAVERITSLLGDFVPQEGRIQQIVQEAVSARGQVSLIALGGLLWTGTRVFGTLTRALNIAYEADDSYGFFKRLLIEAVMLLTIGLVLILALASGFLFDLLWQVLQFVPERPGLAYMVVEWLIRALLLVGAFFLIYQFVPRGKHDWRSSVVGAVTATLLFLIAAPVFQYYVNTFGNYNLIYGSVAIVVIVLILVWLVSVITLFGGEIASHTQGILIEGRSPAEVGRRHESRAPDKPKNK